MLKLSHPLFIAALGCVLFGGACSSSDTTTPAPNFDIDLTRVDVPLLPLCSFVAVPSDQNCEPSHDHDGDIEVDLRCDGTLAVGVATTPLPPNQFLLRPANSCGASSLCGYVRIEGLDRDGAVLASVDTATTEGVLQLAPEQLPELAQIRASLIRGVDQQPVVNSDQKPVETVRSFAFVAPAGCAPLSGAGGEGAGGEAGQGGQAGQAGLGGAGGVSSPDLPGGAGGVPDSAAGAGAGGAAGAAGAAGASNP